jgi:hypothetical protein
MAASAKAWIVSGMTTPLEVQKVLGVKFWTELAEEHGKEIGPLNFDVGSEVQQDRRMKVLLLSHDEALATRLKAALSYGVERVADENAAVTYIAQHGNVIAMVIDSALCIGAAQDWLVALRTALTSSGLPALFVLRDGAEPLQVLLDRFGAMQITEAETLTDALPAAVNRLLQGIQ